MTTIEKPWGKEEILETNENYTVKRLTMFKRKRCSLQYHNFKKETIYCLEGLLYVYYKELGWEGFGMASLRDGETITIDPRIIHRMEAKDNDCVYLECSTSQLDDVVRIEDDYNRK